MTTPRDDTGTDIADHIERLGRLLRARDHRSGLNPAQWEALRYLGRCNRLSNNPTALAGFLGATKGTVSQTLSTLARKGLIRKVPRPGQGRSLSLVLTPRARSLLARDPRADIGAAAAGLGPGAAHLAAGLDRLLAEWQAQNGFRSFGRCRSCRFFRERGPGDKAHVCGLLGIRIDEAEAARICAEHEPAAAS